MFHGSPFDAFKPCAELACMVDLRCTVMLLHGSLSIPWTCLYILVIQSFAFLFG